MHLRGVTLIMWKMLLGVFGAFFAVVGIYFLIESQSPLPKGATKVTTYNSYTYEYCLDNQRYIYYREGGHKTFNESFIRIPQADFVCR